MYFKVLAQKFTVNKSSSTILFSLLTIIVLFSFFPAPQSSAASFSISVSESVKVSGTAAVPSTVSWSAGSYFVGDGCTTCIVHNQVTVTDLTAKGSGTIQISLKSHMDPKGIPVTLTETPPNSGTFINTNILFSNGTGLIPINTTPTITANMPDANVNPGAKDIIDNIGSNPNDPQGFLIISTSDTTGINPTFTETGDNTGIFTAQMLFTTGPSVGTHLHVSPGDEVSIIELDANIAANFIVTPNANPDFVALPIDTQDGDVATASYKGVSRTATIQSQNCPGPNCGGGGGGPIATPGLVLEAIIPVGGGGGAASPGTPPIPILSTSSGGPLPSNVKNIILNENPTTPLAPLNIPSLQLPLTINNNAFPIALSANTIQTQVGTVGVPIKLKLLLNNNYDIVHVSLLTNLRDKAKNIGDSDTAIIYENGKDPQIIDPHGYFANVKVNKVISGNKYEFDFEITFAKPMDTSDIIVRSWNWYLASSDIDIMKAWKVVPQQETSQAQIPAIQSSQNLVSTPPPASSPAPATQSQSIDVVSAIKDWGGYSPNPITDQELLKDVGMKGQHIPPWVLKTTRWVVDGSISNEEFLNVLGYLSDKGLIK